MSIEVLPLGFRCNIGCKYCYQDPTRAAENEGHPKYDMGRMKEALLREGYAFTVFGGEPLLMGLPDLEELFRFGLEQFGERARRDGRSPNSIQTNGTLITEKHIELFKKYGVGVGLSIDGPGELNGARVSISQIPTEKLTDASLWALDRLLEERLRPSLIVTLSKANASRERLPVLLEWFVELEKKGLRYVNLHLLEVDGEKGAALNLSEDESVDALLSCAKLQSWLDLTFEPITDMVGMLEKGLGDPTSCVWNGCDPYTTDAVRGVGGQGERLNCGRTYKEGIQFQKADQRGFERYLALYYTPQAYGGCAGCRFFFACKGQCPGTAEQGDWRGKTEHCGVLMRVFGALEALLIRRGKTPVSLDDGLRREEERRLLVSWGEGGRTAPDLSNRPHGDIPHGDHDDAERPVITHNDHSDQEGRAAWRGL